MYKQTRIKKCCVKSPAEKLQHMKTFAFHVACHSTQAFKGIDHTTKFLYLLDPNSFSMWTSPLGFCLITLVRKRASSTQLFHRSVTSTDAQKVAAHAGGSVYLPWYSKMRVDLDSSASQDPGPRLAVVLGSSSLQYFCC